MLCEEIIYKQGYEWLLTSPEVIIKHIPKLLIAVKWSIYIFSILKAEWTFSLKNWTFSKFSSSKWEHNTKVQW